MFSDHAGFDSGYYYIDPNQGSPVDALQVYCKKNATRQTCVIDEAKENTCSQHENLKWCGCMVAVECTYRCSDSVVPSDRYLKITTSATGPNSRLTKKDVRTVVNGNEMDVFITGRHEMFPIRKLHPQHVCGPTDKKAHAECTLPCYG